MAMINTDIRCKVQGASKNASLTPYPLPLTTGSRGFALLVAVIFTSVMLSFGLALSSLAYKQQVLASSATESQYAFYVADAALECALYADQGLNQNIFKYNSDNAAPIPTFSCSSYSPYAGYPTRDFAGSGSTAVEVLTYRFQLDSDKRCADVKVYKPASTGTTYLFSQGYDVPCSRVDVSGARFVSRGLSAHY